MSSLLYLISLQEFVLMVLKVWGHENWCKNSKYHRLMCFLLRFRRQIAWLSLHEGALKKDASGHHFAQNRLVVQSLYNCDSMSHNGVNGVY